jgi:hypothetical protein
MKIKEIYQPDININPLSVRIIDEKKAKIKELKKQIADINKTMDLVGNINN